MKQETNKPLYKVLNEERTQDFLISFKNPENKKNEYILQSANSKIFTHHVNSNDSVGNNEAKANAQYRALAVNNLHHLAEALEKIANWLEDEGNVKYQHMNFVAKEALKKIS